MASESTGLFGQNSRVPHETAHPSRRGALTVGDVVSLARLEVRECLRDGRLRILVIVVAALLVLATLAGLIQSQQLRETSARADAKDRATFLDQGERNPHSVAHFGQFAFRPTSVLTFLDRGVIDYTGTALWMEAHYRNTAEFRPAEDALELARFAPLTPAVLLQLVAPLLIAVLAAGAIARERERGTLRMLIAQGVGRGHLFAGKLLGQATVLAIALVPALFLAVVALSLFIDSTTDSGTGERLALSVAFHAAYLLALLAIAIAFSSLVRRPNAALIAFAALWLVAILALPRAASELSARLYEIPAAEAFWAAIQKDIREGIDGHNPSDARSKTLEQEVLARYGVTTLEALPVSFAGIALQASEVYGDRVFDRHYGRLHEIHERQESLQGAFAWLSPAIAIRNLSAALAGTDAWHQRHFAYAAEMHRRRIVALLNDDMTRHGRGKDFDYLAGPALWNAIPTFRYEAPSLAETLARHRVEIMALAVWLAGGLAFAGFALRRVSPLA